jgi:hypothetical protein
MLSLAEIKYKIEQLASQINVPANLMPTFGTSMNDGTPCIEVDDSLYYYSAVDRDVKTVNRQTSDFNELLFWVFHFITFLMAVHYEANNRVPNESHDYRKAMFAYQLVLLNKLSPMLRKRGEQEIAEILRNHPYR